MNKVATLGVQDTQATSIHADRSRQQSLLFPALFEQLDKSRKLTVLEVGQALPDTVDFFSRYKCRLHFAGLFADSLLQEQGELDEAALLQRFTALFALPKGTRIDLCLFWDVFHYLDDKAVRAMSKALAPYLHSGSRGHGFAVRTKETALRNNRYGIEAAHMFSVRPAQRVLAYHPHSQAILINLLTCFDIDRGMLLPDGRLEVALTASVS